MVGIDFNLIVFAGMAILLLHALSRLLPLRQPTEFPGDEVEGRKPVSTV